MFHRILVNQFFSRYFKPSNLRLFCRGPPLPLPPDKEWPAGGISKGKVSIVGGSGSNPIANACLYSLLTKSSAKELCLIGTNGGQAEGEIMEFGPCIAGRGDIEVYGGDDYRYTNCSEVVVMLPSIYGVSKEEINKTESNWQEHYQAELLNCKNIVSKVIEFSRDAKFLVAFGPDSVYCHGVHKWTNLNPNQIFGIGTLVESMHFAHFISEHFQCKPNEVFAPIFGDKMCPVPIHSLVTVKGEPVKGEKDEMALGVLYGRALRATMQIQIRKGYYGWLQGQAAANLVEDLLANRERPDAFTRYTQQKDTGFSSDLFFSLPATGLKCNEVEKKTLANCAKWLSKDVIGKLEF